MRDSIQSTLVLSNDPGVILNDVRSVDLNRVSTVASVKVAGELTRWSEPPPEYLQPPPIEMPNQRKVVVETSLAPLEQRTAHYDEFRLRSEASVENVRVWYIVRVLPSGLEVERHPLPDAVASDPANLFEKLRDLGLPNGRYRIYLEELGFPRRLVHEFYKSGNSFGEPVRERGPGSNPTQGSPDSSIRADDRQASITSPAAAAVVSVMAGSKFRRGQAGWAERVDKALEHWAWRNEAWQRVRIVTAE